MPRAARKKSPECMYHVTSRSISEIDMFQCNEDKSYYLKLLKRYKDKYYCSIYCYILMDNHIHIYINPRGADISSFMHSLNTAYVSYYNRRYERHGHLFQGRFGSNIVYNDTYSLALSAYIHNNAKDLPGYCGKEELYRYSSYGIYTGHRKDYDEIVDPEFILNTFSNDKKTAQEKYRVFTESMKDTDMMKEIGVNITRSHTENEYKGEISYVLRNNAPDEVLRKIGEILNEKLPGGVRLKYDRETSNIRAFSTYILRVLCGYTYKQLCEYIGNISMSGIYRLSNKGFRLLREQSKYWNAFNDLIQLS